MATSSPSAASHTPCGRDEPSVPAGTTAIARPATIAARPAWTSATPSTSRVYRVVRRGARVSSPARGLPDAVQVLAGADEDLAAGRATS